MGQPVLKRTPLYETHVALNGRLVEFGGWEMPVLYTSIVKEHLAVRDAAGLFDISHMGEFLFEGPDAKKFLNKLLTNDLARLEPGQGQYSLLCQDNGGVIDDLYAYRLSEIRYLLVVNASRVEVDWMWIRAQRNTRYKSLKLEMTDASGDHAALALQGPKSAAILDGLFPAAVELEKNRIAELEFGGAPIWMMVADQSLERFHASGFAFAPSSPRLVLALVLPDPLPRSVLQRTPRPPSC